MEQKIRNMVQAIRDYFGANKSHWIQHTQHQIVEPGSFPSYCVFGAAKAFLQGSLGDPDKPFIWFGDDSYNEEGTELASTLGFENVHKMADWNNSVEYSEIIERLDNALIEQEVAI